jgi:hypothetical protein
MAQVLSVEVADLATFEQNFPIPHGRHVDPGQRRALNERYPNRSAITPPTIATVRSVRCSPNFSLSTSVPIAGANNTEESHWVATLTSREHALTHNAVAHERNRGRAAERRLGARVNAVDHGSSCDDRGVGEGDVQRAVARRLARVREASQLSSTSRKVPKSTALDGLGFVPGSGLTARAPGLGERELGRPRAFGVGHRDNPHLGGLRRQVDIRRDGVRQRCQSCGAGQQKRKHHEEAQKRRAVGRAVHGLVLPLERPSG